ncbi:FAD-binding protein [Natroniella acetigena]|uniref:FAD-binding oxidoreductase n=1 Tax=Natroniella acetigena TaxID=52004 RepID=UPI00200B91A6|nr:FAD-linked oxidase C-terminal domain-containing protein [Natroniella acetigena]MCK8826189.1 FAD-binding protein [Natroniella acetigena]
MFKQSLINRFKDILGEDNVLTSKEDLLSYSFDSTPDFESIVPELVVMPESTEQVSEVVKIANEKEINIIPRGAGTNLCGGTIPVENSIVVVLTKMNKILEIDEENLTVTVEAGVITQAINEAVEARELFFPPDPGTVAVSTIGGNIAECAGGLRGLKYGVTKDYVMGVEVVLPTGKVINAGGKTVKNVTGYDLPSLYSGSEGTLGIITQATLKLLPLPDTKKSMMAIFDKLDGAAETISSIIRNKVIPVTLEIMDQVTIQSVEEFANIGLPTEAAAILLIEVDGIEEVVERDAKKVVKICKENGAREVKLAKNEEERFEIWEARRASLSALGRMRPTTILEDATVPRSNIPDMIRGVNKIAEKYDLHIGTFGHAGDGNLHPTILADERNEEEMKRVHKAVEEIFDLALGLDGTLSGEHGIGIAKAKYMTKELGEDGLQALRDIKFSLDPKGILNPHKVIGAGDNE